MHRPTPPIRTDLVRRLRALPPPLFSLADQAAVSGLNFLTGIGAARWLGIDGFGHFALVLIFASFAQCLHSAVAATPLMTLAGARGRVDPGYGASLVVGAVLLCLPLGALIVAGLAVSGQTSPGVLLATAALVLAQNLQFTLRRMLFARGEGLRALVMDIGRALAVALAAGAVWLADASVGPAGLLWMLAAAALVTSLPYALPFAAPVLRQPRRLRLSAVAWRHRPVAAWLFPLVFVTFAQEQAVWIAVSLILGADALGGLRAAQYLVGIVLLLLSATENVVPIRAAQAYTVAGTRGLDRYLAGVAIRLGLPLGLLLAALLGPAETCLRLMFGPEYAPYAGCLRVLALCGFVVFLRDLAAHHFRARQTTGIIFQALVVSLVVSAMAAYPLLHLEGVTGAALAVLLGHSASLVYLLAAIRVAPAPGADGVAWWPLLRTARRGQP